MKKRLVFTLLLFVLFFTACNSGDELSGKTFKVAYSSPLVESEDPNGYNTMITVEFLDGKVIIDSIEGTYQFNGDILTLNFENENEDLEINFTVKNSDKEFSEYAAEISEVTFEMENTEKVSYFKNLVSKLNKNIPVEFIEK